MQILLAWGIERMNDIPLGVRPGLREAATVVALLKEADVSAVAGFLSSSKVRAISDCIKRLSDLTVSDLIRVLELFENDFRNTLPVGFGIGDRLDRVVDNPLERVYADSLLESLDEAQSLSGLQGIAPERLASILSQEQRNLQMIVLVCIKPEQAAQVLMHMPEENRSALVSAMGRLDKIPRRVLLRVAEFLGGILQSEKQELSIKLPGINVAAAILKHMNQPAVDALLTELRQTEQKMAEELAAQMFVFANLADLTKESLARLISQFDNRTLALSLKGMDVEFQEKFYATLSRRAAGYLRDEYDSTGPVRRREVIQNRQKMVDVALSLLHSGEIEIETPGQQNELME